VEPEIIYSDWMSVEDKHMIGIEGLDPGLWEQFRPLVERKSETEFGIVEQRRFEECLVVLGPDNDVMVGSTLVVWSPSLISAYKSSAYSNYPIATSALALDHRFDTPQLV
jgi:hypothetical protein